MRCSACKAEVPDGEFCDNCGAKLLSSSDSDKPVITKGDIGLDKSTTILLGGSGKSETTAGDYCPVCGKYNRRETTFRCMHCGRTDICVEHQDQHSFLCLQCAGQRSQPDDTLSAQLFQLNYELVHPYVPMNEDVMTRVLISFTTREDVIFSVPKINTHLCLVLDVSGSMNREDKYPLLRQAIPHLVESLSDDDYLTIILFSHSHDTVLFDQVERIRGRVDELLFSIDQSGVMFGHHTFLAPGLQAALDEIEHFRKRRPTAVNRLYVLTDGELHDAEACYRLNPHLRTLEAEIHSYGFGQDFALDTIKRLMEDIPGGTVKPIFNTRDVQDTFSHIGELSQRIVAQDAELTFTFAKDAIAGDAFRYRPGTHYFGTVNQHTKTFKTRLGALERDRIYTFMFEGQLQQVSEERQQVGTAKLRYTSDAGWEQAETTVIVRRTRDTWRHEKPNQKALEIYQILDALRNDDPQVQLRALRARQAIYQREETDPVLVELVERAISKLERGESLSESERRGLRADKATQRFGIDEENIQDAAAIWLQRGYDPTWAEWLVRVAHQVAQDEYLKTLETLSPIEVQVVQLALKGQNPQERLSEAELEAFERAIHE